MDTETCSECGTTVADPATHSKIHAKFQQAGEHIEQAGQTIEGKAKQAGQKVERGAEDAAGAAKKDVEGFASKLKSKKFF